MGPLVGALRTLKLWQISLLLAVFVLAIVFAYRLYSHDGELTQTSLAENHQLITVQYGNLINQISTNGNLLYPNREKLSFSTAGTVGVVLVEEGQRVANGETLASLDSATIVSLEKQVAQARVNLRDAMEDLETIRVGPSTDDINEAESAVSLATNDLGNAHRDFKLSQQDWANKSLEAQQPLDVAKEAYHDVFRKWLGVDISDYSGELSPGTLLGALGIELNSVFDLARRMGSIQDDPSTSWNEVVVNTWLSSPPGRIIGFPVPYPLVCESDESVTLAVCIEKEIEQFWEVYSEAEANLDEIQTQSATSTAKTSNAVIKAEIALANAVEALDNLNVDPDPLALALREADVNSVQVELDMALSRLAGVALRTPIEGIVAVVNVEEGESVNPNTGVFEVVDSSVVEVDGIVDEIDVLYIARGARASVSLDALPGETLEGTLSYIGSAATNQQGVVTYPIRILLQVSPAVHLVEGLSATADIILREERNVLLIPQQSLYGTFQQPFVRLMDNGLIQERAVILGNGDDFWVVVLEGLVEGDQVVIETTQATTSELSLGRLRGAGGFSGSGR